MNRVQYMTLGLVLAFVGSQLYFIDTYVLTPQATKWVGKADKSELDPLQNSNFAAQSPQDYNRVFQQANYSQSTDQNGQWKTLRNITHPKWICWPVFFLGAVFFLHGIALRDSSSSDN